jgi:hypothetical protein
VSSANSCKKQVEVLLSEFRMQTHTPVFNMMNNAGKNMCLITELFSSTTNI